MFPVFDNGSCWVKVDFHLHTNADKEFRYDGEPDRYYADYITALSAAGIGLGVITNHNKFALDEFKIIRKKARKEGIGILPGVELSISDGQAGIHTLIIFSDGWYDNKEQTNHIQSFLTTTFAGISNFENENARSNHNIKQTIEELDKYNKDYFIVFAHVEAPNGLWGGLKPVLVKELFERDEIRRRVLGFQKVLTRDKRLIMERELGQWYPAEVEGCDAKNMRDMTSRPVASYLKLGDYTFEALQFALRDYPSRVLKQKPDTSHSHIQRIAFEGAGSLGGTVMNLSPELNTLIGIRGSGKSSILEGIRYALDIEFGDKTSEKEYKESLVENLLKSGGKITLDVTCRRGIKYQIRRIYQRAPEVYVNGEQQTGVSIRETVLHNPMYFGQKDLSNTGEGFEKDLIEKLAGEKLIPVRKEIQEKSIVVQDLLRLILRLDNSKADLQSWTEKSADANFKLNLYKEHGVEEKLLKQTTFDRDERHFSERAALVTTTLDKLQEQLAEALSSLNQEELYVSPENQAFIDDFEKEISGLIKNIEEMQRTVTDSRLIALSLDTKTSQFTVQKNSLNEEFAETERKISQDLQSAGAHKISTTEFRTLTADLEFANKEIEKFSKSVEEKDLKHQELGSELSALNQLWVKEHNEILQVLAVINETKSGLKISSAFKADKKSMLTYLKSTFQGSKFRDTTYQLITEMFSDFGDMWINQDKVLSVISNPETFTDYMNSNIIELITWQPPNVYTIEFRGKPLNQHSLGQRASALMLFVLNQRNNDIIIIDQPEDDLDNQTIYEDVIKLIRDMKLNTQFIFATHNANIPVLGDAEYIHACVYADGKINTSGGGIDCDPVQKQIIAVMEGGKEAFERRRNVYSAWLK
ncbi:TPA: histidinol-phosphatase [Yersinia enterocolitica]|nr:histidinol-phosphatase [Yersinia enterocolitica]HDL6890662.1 histidinol-phosphatase [Yersinia enterocolitica]